MIDIKVPAVGESISEVTLLKWNKKDGEYVERDEVIAEMESEKATFEVNAEKAGVLKIAAEEGDTIKIGDLLASIDENAAKPNGNGVDKTEEKIQGMSTKAQEVITKKRSEEKKAKEKTPEAGLEQQSKDQQPATDIKATPVASAMIADKNIKASSISPSGFGGKILKDDVLAALANPGKVTGGKPLFSREEKKEKMTLLRKTISRRLVEAKNTTAMLTTFNEVDMSRIMDIRNKYKEKFKEIHNVGLGFMSFFAKACCIALQEWPSVNAYIDGDQLIFHDYCDISIAVSTPRGLTVPVIRHVER